jgi:hypothetical protein
MECQNYVKENNKLRIVARTVKHERAKMKRDVQIILDGRQGLKSMNIQLKSNKQNVRDQNARIQEKIDALTMKSSRVLKR